MEFETPLIKAELVRRYKRFLADVVLENGETVTVHCPNTGSMLGCQTPGSSVWLLPVDNPRRKYPLGWELVEAAPATLVGINTHRSNALVAEALRAELIAPLAGYRNVRREITLVNRGSRMDFLLSDHAAAADCYVEVKNVTAAVEAGCAVFPDAVSARATRHLKELEHLVAGGHRGVLVFCIQRGDVERVRPADEIDAEYGAAFRAAAEAGVEIYAYRAQISPRAVSLDTRVEVCLD